MDATIALVHRCQAGEHAAFGTLVEAYGGRIYNYLLRMVGDANEAEDLAQEVFVRAWEALPHFRGGGAFSTWLYRIATNLAIDAVRRRKRRPAVESLDEAVDVDDGQVERQVADPGRPLEDRLAARELQRAVWEAIAKLPPKLRAVLLMYDFEQLTYQQIAAVLRVPMGTVKSRLFSARQQLRQMLAERLPIEDYIGRVDEMLR